jgi:hypothetical protein
MLPLLAMSLLVMQSQQAGATSSSAGVSLQVYDPNGAGSSITNFQIDSATPVTETLPGAGVTGNAKSVVATGSVGVGMDLSPSTPYGFYNASANWNDSWSAGAATNVGATLTLNGQISTSLLTSSVGYWDLRFRYAIDGNYLLYFEAWGDGGAARISAQSGGTNITSSIILTTNAGNPLLTDFSLSYNPTFTTTGAFSEFMDAKIMIDDRGPMTIDVFHTFHAELRSLDPAVLLTDETGRSAVLAVPEPETCAMMLAGLGLLGFTTRRRKQKDPA